MENSGKPATTHICPKCGNQTFHKSDVCEKCGYFEVKGGEKK